MRDFQFESERIRPSHPIYPLRKEKMTNIANTKDLERCLLSITWSRTRRVLTRVVIFRNWTMNFCTFPESEL